MKRGAIGVLIVDDHALVRSGIRRLLEDVPSVKVLGEASSGEEALTFVRDHGPDVVLLDVKMPGIGGLETTRRIKRLQPNSKIIAVTAFQEEPYPSRLMQAGASGYLTKESGLDQMVSAIEQVHSGRPYISAEVAQQMALKSLCEPIDGPSIESLSDRELQVMIMIASGLKVQEISTRLYLSSKTVNSYRYRLFEKLNVKNDVELTHIAIRHNLVEKSYFSSDRQFESEG